MLRLRYLLPLVFLLALLVRVPTLGLPLEGESAVLASVADHLGHDRGWTLAGHAPLMPTLVSIPVASGAAATSALRWTDALLAALLAPLVLLLGQSLGLARSGAAAAGILMAIHPLGLRAAGGVQPGSGTLAAALLLCILLALLSGRTWRRRLGALGVLLLVATDVGAWPYVPGLLWLSLRGEASARVQTGIGVLGACLLVTGGLLWGAPMGRAAPSLGAGLFWLALATLVVLLPGLPAGLGAIWRRGQVERTLLASAGLCLLVGLFGGPVLALPLLPVVVLAGLIGTPRVFLVRKRRIVLGALGSAAVISTFFVWGGLQVALSGGRPSATGRLYLLREAMVEAESAVGARGWIVLAVGDDSPALQTSLADLSPGHWTWAQRESRGRSEGEPLRRLRVFPAASLEAGRSVVVVAEAGTRESIHTFDGAGIYHHEVIRRLGPYVVLRARRP